ncbi:antA/AntB antirepressor family protein [Ornithobacterium rhinotracheale]
MKQLQEIIKGEKQLIDARLLYQELNVGRDFSNWIKGRIEKYDFQENRDYFIDNHRSPDLASNRGDSNYTDNQILPQNGGKSLEVSQNIENQCFAKMGESKVIEKENFTNAGGDRRSINYFLTIGMAKELCLLQNNEIGRAYRKYLIAFEENAKKQFIQMPKSINVFGMEALPYDWWLLQNGYSVSSGQRNRRIKNHPEHFYKGTNGWYINKLYAEALLAIKLGKEKLQQVQALPQLNQLEMF